MRNLKKFLALVLAMMMVFSLMVTVNAATYPDMDKAEDAFVEGIEVLSGVGVIKGDEKGNFNPTANITRAEAAAIMYRIVTGDVKDEHNGLHTGAVQFTDVKDGDWFAGYVGYCADQGIIKGRPDGSFGPQANVTGYEMLAMLLRAIGYGQKGEFTGYGWEVSVGSRATTLGILNNVKTTAYGGNLRIAARRDVVADLAFQSITLPPMVTVSSLGDYNPYTSLVSEEFNPTLGEKVFNLADMTGIIVGNQMTGEKFTKLGCSLAANGLSITSNGSYIYTTDNDGYENITLAFNTKTGLDMFGHKVTVWYNYNSNNKDAAETVNTGDAAVSYKTEYGTIYTVIDKSTKSDVVYAADADLTTTDAALNKAVKAAGFSIDATNGAYESDSFAQITQKGTNNITDDNGTSGAFLLISNSGKKGDETNALDLIVPLEVSVDAIDAVNNYSKPKTVKHTTDTTEINRSVPDDKDQSILVYGEDSIAVGQGVVLNKIYGTGTEGITAAGTQFFYGIDALTEEKAGVVRSISGDGTVTLDDGSTLKRSPLWNVTGGGGDADPVNGDGADELLIGASLTFILDVNGKYVDCYKGGATTLLGAYAYWTQEGIDGFKYFLQGVNNKGEVVTREVTRKSYDDVIAKSADDVEIHHMTSGTAATGSSVNIANPGENATGLNGYAVYTIDGNNTVAATVLDKDDSSNNTSWNKKIIRGENWTAKTGGVGSTSNYFNAETKFHVVSGWGSTLKVDTYTGLTDLLQGAASIEATGWYFTAVDDTEHVGSQNNVVTHVLLVGATRIQPNTFLYTGATAPTGAIGTTDSKAHQFQVYTVGQDTTAGVLIEDTTSPGTAETLAANTFYRYSLTAEGYYKVTADDMDGTEYGYTSNVLTNAGTAFGDIKDDTKTYHATDAKVIDLTGHGIDSYMALRRAVEENSGIKVDVLLTSAGGDTVSVIYVHTFA